MAFSTDDPVYRLSSDILELCDGHSLPTVIAAIGASLGVVLDELRAETHAPKHDAAAKFRHDLQQVVAEAMYLRPGARES